MTGAPPSLFAEATSRASRCAPPSTHDVLRLEVTIANECKARSNLAASLDDVAVDVEEALGGELRALLVVGPFAREEGGWVMGPHGLTPDGEVDLVAVVDGGEHRMKAKLASVALGCLQAHGFAIDLRAMSVRSLAPPPPTLFWLDVALGGRRVLWGSEVGLRLDDVTPDRVALDEPARLLAIRATGLALSNLRGTDPTIRARRLHDAVLAYGDAVLLGAGRTCGSSTERLTILRRSPDLASRALVSAYADAVRFRARPDRWQSESSTASFSQERLALLESWHLTFERQRIGTPVDPTGYAEHPLPLFALDDLPAVPRTLYQAVHRLTGGGSIVAMHPRERLARASVALAYAPRVPAARAAACRLLGKRLEADDGDLAGALERARDQWR